MLSYQGKFYGITREGGKFSTGTIFEWDPDSNNLKTLYHFEDSISGTYPSGNIFIHNGILYGNTGTGRTNDFGAIFSWNINTSTFGIVYHHDYAGFTYSKGYTEYKGKLYGFANEGQKVVLTELDPITNSITKKLELQQNEAGTDVPMCFVNNKFYGSQSAQSAKGGGAVFEWDPEKNTYQTLVAFSQDSAPGIPVRGLIHSNGKLYGLGWNNGYSTRGSIFEYDLEDRQGKVLLKFQTSKNGAWPSSGLARINDRLVGTTFYGGTNEAGLLYEWIPETKTLKVLQHFDTIQGKQPFGALTVFNNTLYGSLSNGDSCGGLLYEWLPESNQLNDLIRFNQNELGFYPNSAPIVYHDNLLGLNAGNLNYGATFYQYNPQSTVITPKIQFDTEILGAAISQPIISGNKVYGTSRAFKERDNGTFTSSDLLYEYDPVTNVAVKKMDFTFETGSLPTGALVVLNGRIYGVTTGGGKFGQGVLFEFNPEVGTYTIKKSFDSTAFGAYPNGGLTLFKNRIYGTTTKGGDFHSGTIFSYDPQLDEMVKLASLELEDQNAIRELLVLSANDVSVGEQPGIDQFQLFPNPASSMVSVQSPSTGTFEIYDISGREIFRGTISSGANQIDVSSLSTGSYLFKVATNGKVQALKLMKS